MYNSVPMLDLRGAYLACLVGYGMVTPDDFRRFIGENGATPFTMGSRRWSSELSSRINHFVNWDIDKEERVDLIALYHFRFDSGRLDVNRHDRFFKQLFDARGEEPPGNLALHIAHLTSLISLGVVDVSQFEDFVGCKHGAIRRRPRLALNLHVPVSRIVYAGKYSWRDMEEPDRKHLGRAFGNNVYNGKINVREIEDFTLPIAEENDLF